jgi:hypothetical protein
MNAIESYNAIPAIANAHSILTQKFSDTVADIVVGYEATQLSGKDNWNRQAQFAVDRGCYDKASFIEACVPGEIEVLEFRKLMGEDVQTKAGKWKLSKVCTNSSYSSNKAVIGNALENGISLTDDDGNIKAKSALESEIKDSKDEKSPEDKVGTAFATFTNILNKCNQGTQDRYAAEMVELARRIVDQDMAA